MTQAQSDRILFRKFVGTIRKAFPFFPVCDWSFYSLKSALNRAKVCFILMKSNSPFFSFIDDDIYRRALS